jgi:hypothetical protein
MLGSASAPHQRITHQVQGPEDTVAEEHRAGEQYGQLIDAGGLHQWTRSLTLDRYCSSSVLIDSMTVLAMVVLAVVVLAVVVLVNYRVTLATGDEPAVDREGRHERHGQCERQATPEEQAP